MVVNPKYQTRRTSNFANDDDEDDGSFFMAPAAGVGAFPSVCSYVVSVRRRRLGPPQPQQCEHFTWSSSFSSSSSPWERGGGRPNQVPSIVREVMKEHEKAHECRLGS
jgi:hypothetical protein